MQHRQITTITCLRLFLVTDAIALRPAAFHNNLVALFEGVYRVVAIAAGNIEPPDLRSFRISADRTEGDASMPERWTGG